METVIFVLTAAGLAQAYTNIDADFFMYKNIDPIVMPGQYKSHLHSFYGSDGITANTTTSAELQAGCSTIANPNDLSTYWTPTLIYNNGDTQVPIGVASFKAYYENIGDAEVALPQDMMTLAGRANATTQAETDANANVQWFCEGDPAEDKDLAAFPSTTCSTHLQMLLYFQDCVDTTTLATSYSSKSYGTANGCPAGSSKMPRLRFSIRYDLRKTIPDGWQGEAPLSLSSGNSYSMHGDFVNGWVKDAAENMLQATDKREFQTVTGSRDGTAAPCVGATDADPDHGTSDLTTAKAEQGTKKRSIGSSRVGRSGVVKL